MLAAGEWVHERPELVDVHAGYSLSGLYSPTLSWSDLAEAWERCQNDQGQIKTFVQQKLGRAWRVSGEAPDWQRLYDRREHWPVGVVPMGGLLLTAGVDVQRDRLEVSVWAWGRDRQSWLVDHRLLAGNPFESAVWEELRLLVNEAWRHESGRWMPVALTAIDSGDGVTTGEVYNFVRRLGVGRAIAVKGQDGLRVALGNPTPTEVTRKGKKLRGLKVWPVGSSFIKSETYGWLRLDRPTEESGQSYPAGFIHLPVHTAGEEFCKQLTAEHLVVKNAKNGYRRLEWVKTRDRNEALDCRVYARAAAVLLGVDRWSERRWDKISASLSVPVPGVAAIVESEQGDREDEGAESVVESGPSSSDGARSGPVVRPRSWGAGLGASW
jgi:phage terminase large subunit GpA-like protein